MANDGQIVFEVTADGKHAIADIKEITRAIQTETKNWDRAAKESTDNMSSQFSGMLKKLVAGFSAVKIGQALLNIGKQAIAAASDLEEVQNVVDVTFGDGAAKIESWSKAAGSQFGLTETQAKKFASTLGAMMKSAGMSGDQIVQMSTDLAGLAADMASFYNLDFETAFQKIRSGISGETEPLKQLGINMSVANLNAYALQQGLSKTFEQMSQGEQTMLRYQYMMSATADAQGDFARTSDGYANSLRTLETNLENLKTTIGKTILPVVNDILAAANELFADRSGEPTILDQFKTIDLDTEGKIAEIKKVAEEAQSLIERLGLISETDTSSAGTAIEKYLSMGTNSEEAQRGLAELGLSTDEIADKQREWLRTCKDLVKTIPGLSEIINTETGEVKGGVDAVKQYVDEWQTAQEKFLYWKAYYAKEDAVKQAQLEVYGLQLTAEAARKRANEARDAYEKAFAEAGGTEFYTQYSLAIDYGQQISPQMIEKKAELDRLSADMKKTEEAATKAENEYTQAVEDNSEAIAQNNAEREVLIEKFGEMERVEEKVIEASTTLGKAAQGDTDAITTVPSAVDKANEALKSMADYAESVRTAVANAIDSTVSGFERITSPAQNLVEQLSDLKDQYDAGKLSEEEFTAQTHKLNQKMNEQGLTTKGMIDNLKSQAAFMSEYMKYLDEARARGVSGDVLAELSDGSAESVDRLKALATATDEDIADINELYGNVQDRKKQLTDALTAQKLAADDVYTSLAESARQAVAALDLGQEAADNAGKTVQGLAEGISSNVDSVQAAVDSIIAQLDRLNGWGIDISFGGFGNIHFTTSAGKTEGSGRMGWDYIPRDDFIMRLHEGEGVLTAEENRIWHNVKAGGFSTDDIEALSGAMGASIKPGGNVYLDGRIVGQVISDQQGKSFRALSRSGWQGGK